MHVYRLSEAELSYKKDHFLLPFLDQVPEIVAGYEFYYFLYDYSWYYHIQIALEDQAKKIFTCPFSTFAFRRMPFVLCNALATFQIFMINIYSDIVEDYIEVLIDDFSVFGDRFESFLTLLEEVFQKYWHAVNKKIAFEWEKKCHFRLKMA